MLSLARQLARIPVAKLGLRMTALFLDSGCTRQDARLSGKNLQQESTQIIIHMRKTL